jgi:hypothetical protein
MSRRNKQTPEQAQLEANQLERARELRVENARETTRAFDENIQFRRRLRGIFSLLSQGFVGFPGQGSGKANLGT